MQQVRIVMYPSDAVGRDVVRHWTDTVGASLGLLEGFDMAFVADNGDHLVVISHWQSAAAIEAGLSSPEYQQALSRMLERTGMTAEDSEPSLLYMGPVVADTRRIP